MPTKFIISAILTSGFLLSSAANAQNKSGASEVHPAVIAMLEDYSAESKQRFPWQYKTDQRLRFRAAKPFQEAGRQSHARAAFGWQMISRRLTDKMGAYPNFELFLGITSAGKLEGVIFGDAFSPLRSDEAGAKQIATFESIGITAPGVGELVELTLGPVQSAPLAGKSHKLWFRKFEASNKAYRMFGTLPDESELRLYHTASGKEGSMNYWIGNNAKTTAFTIGYLKEMITTIRNAKQ